MRHLFIFVLVFAQMVFVIGEQWPLNAVLRLRRVGKKLV
jgi:hypothetical protein